LRKFNLELGRYLEKLIVVISVISGFEREALKKPAGEQS
jgi:hypothetical protein